ncbi:NAD(P)/FAD-dependent oxidoreductase [Proteiniclasticum sp.]|uniref:NAD(P)/FAD-dependent oxidoreductase n=1 Tax=Proteiniclasticum sp. TaxID=2053595 RepID=UPI0028A1AB3F|nr:NAD(P)/FAD-dependent oxidoreductase [Proteiniclasticum sp.]
MYDVAIIGAGIVGASVARELSRYNLKVCLIEKENDVSEGATKANSAIVHAGYDPEVGTAMARLNVRGCHLTEVFAKELDVPYKKIGSLVVAFSEAELKTIEELYHRGNTNGVPDQRLIGREELLKMEPNIGDAALGALHSPSAGIVGPWEFCIALTENAVVNGVELMLGTEVVDIKKEEDIFTIYTANLKIDPIRTRYIVNAAGIYSDVIMGMVGEREFKIKPRKGQYFVLDKNQGPLANHVIFQCPSELGKGILVTPSVHGNLIVGPDAEDNVERDDKSTSKEQMDFIREAAERSIKGINYRESIRNFAGLRAQSDRSDFIIEESKSVKGFVNLAGIKSPGLTSAPAIAEDAVEILKNIGLEMEKREDFNPIRRQTHFMALSPEEKTAKIKEDPKFGRVICRCENITEGEIVEAIKRPVGALSVDGVKRRVRPGMGRCQGGFCGPRVLEIISRELNVPLEEVMQDTSGSYILVGETKK